MVVRPRRGVQTVTGLRLRAGFLRYPLGSQAIQGGQVLLLHGLGERRRDGRRRGERRDDFALAACPRPCPRAATIACLAARAIAAHALAACALTARIAGGYHRAARAARWRVRRDDFALTARPRCRALICGKKCRVYVVVFCVVLVSVRVACVV